LVITMLLKKPLILTYVDYFLISKRNVVSMFVLIYQGPRARVHNHLNSSTIIKYLRARTVESERSPIWGSIQAGYALGRITDEY
jgi:hypothetical protein